MHNKNMSSPYAKTGLFIRFYLNKEEYTIFKKYGELLFNNNYIKKNTDYSVAKYILMSVCVQGLKQAQEQNKTKSNILDIKKDLGIKKE